MLVTGWSKKSQVTKCSVGACACACDSFLRCWDQFGGFCGEDTIQGVRVYVSYVTLELPLMRKRSIHCNLYQT